MQDLFELDFFLWNACGQIENTHVQIHHANTRSTSTTSSFFIVHLEQLFARSTSTTSSFFVVHLEQFFAIVVLLF